MGEDDSACRAGAMPAEVTAVPTGLALAWLGYALWSERREHAADPVPSRASPQLRRTAAE